MRRLPLFLLLASTGCSNLGSETTDARLKVADVALASGVAAPALQIAQEMLTHHPDDVQALIRQGQAEYLLNNMMQAEGSFNRVLAIAPGNVEALLGLGRVKLRADAAEAAELFQQASDHEPASLAALTDLGVARDLQGQHAAAQILYRQVLARRPDQLTAQADLGLSLALTGDVAKSIAYLRPLAADPAASKRVKADLAVALVMADDIPDAQQLIGEDMSPLQVSAALAGYEAIRHTAP
ncbi:MAG: tetratricopeptide repeat protein [Janthinobacterium lividum]